MIHCTMCAYNNNYPYRMTYLKYCLGNKVRSTVFFRANHYAKKHLFYTYSLLTARRGTFF